MSFTQTTGPRSALRVIGSSVLRVIGSLWLAAVLLVALLVAMACATVYESAHGTERALYSFYRDWWFQLLLALLAANVAAAMIARYPFSRRQIGFVLTHAGLLVTLGGALITKHWGVDGQVGIVEGQTVDHFNVREPALTIRSRADRTRATVELDPSTFSGFETLEEVNPDVTSGPLRLGNVAVEAKRYLPDSRRTERVVNDNPHARPAVEIAMTGSGGQHSGWVFADETIMLGALKAGYRVIPDAEELARLIDDGSLARDSNLVPADSAGMVKAAYRGASFDVPLPDAQARAVPLGDTGYSLRVLRYLPHATVGPDNKLVNASDRPVNPAVEVELTGPDGKETRLAFARFPDFSSMHGDRVTKELKLTFEAPSATKPTAPIEVLGGPSGELYVRAGARPLVRDSNLAPAITSGPLTVGAPVDLPWPGRQLTVLRRFDRARRVREVLPITPVRQERVPALLVKLTTDKDTREMWLQKYRPEPVNVDGKPLELFFGDREISLGYHVRLDRFRVGYYPGGRRPRSFESHITIIDPAAGGEQSRLVSMNNPTKHGGYTFYQSSYRQDGGRTISFLSVARDPGLPIVFAGYVMIMMGMTIVLITRMVSRRRAAKRSAAAETKSDSTRTVDLLGQSRRCTQ